MVREIGDTFHITREREIETAWREKSRERQRATEKEREIESESELAAMPRQSMGEC